MIKTGDTTTHKQQVIDSSIAAGFEPKVPGRKCTPLDMKIISDFLEVGMPVAKIATYFNCSPNILYDRAGDLIAQKSLQFEYEIREMQLAVAKMGDVKMLVHLGKTVLKQTEAIPSVTEEGSTVQWTVKPPISRGDPVDEDES